jgi:hypothetical protein
MSSAGFMAAQVFPNGLKMANISDSSLAGVLRDAWNTVSHI